MGEQPQSTTPADRAAWSTLLADYGRTAGGTMGQLRAGMRIAEVSQEAMRRLIEHVERLEGLRDFMLKDARERIQDAAAQTFHIGVLRAENETLRAQRDYARTVAVCLGTDALRMMEMPSGQFSTTKIWEQARIAPEHDDGWNWQQDRWARGGEVRSRD